MAKPILVVRCPQDRTEKEVEEILSSLKKKIKDYHIIIVSEEINSFKFECLNPESEPLVSLEEIVSKCSRYSE